MAIVDDNPDVASTLASAVQVAGHRAVRYPDGRSALDGMNRQPPDVVLLDAGLPDMSGAAVLSALRALPPLARTVVIGMSGAGMRGQETLAADTFEHFLLKPVDLRHLRRLLQAVAARRSAVPTLVVEDHLALLTSTMEVLRRNGFDPTPAASAQEALALVDRARPRLLLCDLNLPDMSGLALVEQLKPRLDALGCYVAVVTALPDDEIGDYNRRAGEFGVDQFVGKPFDLSWLKAVHARLRAGGASGSP